MEKINSFLHKRRYLLGFIAVTAFSLAIAAYYRANIVMAVKTAYPQYAGLLTAAVVICAVLAIVSYVLIVRLNTNTVKVYLIMSLIAAVILPAECTEVGSLAFTGCAKLHVVRLEGGATVIAPDAFPEQEIVFYVPAGSAVYAQLTEAGRRVYAAGE